MTNGSFDPRADGTEPDWDEPDDGEFDGAGEVVATGVPLAACPHCGGQALCYLAPEAGLDDAPYYVISCLRCSPAGATPDEAAARWNTRATR